MSTRDIASRNCNRFFLPGWVRGDEWATDIFSPFCLKGSLSALFCLFLHSNERRSASATIDSSEHSLPYILRICFHALILLPLNSYEQRSRRGVRTKEDVLSPYFSR